MRIGLGWDYDLAAVAAVRAAIGPDHDVMADGTHRYDAESAARTADFLAANNVFWFEEPFEPHELDEYTALTALKILRLDQSQQRSVPSVHRDHRMQIKPTAAIGAHNRRVLDRQHMAAAHRGNRHERTARGGDSQAALARTCRFHGDARDGGRAHRVQASR